MKNICLFFICFFVFTKVNAQVNNANSIRYTLKLLFGADYLNPKQDSLRFHYFYYSNKLVELVEKVEINKTVDALDLILNDVSPMLRDNNQLVVTKVLVTDLETKTTHVFDTFSTAAKRLQTLAYDSVKIGFKEGINIGKPNNEDYKKEKLLRDTLIKNIPHKFNADFYKDVNGKDTLINYTFLMDKKIKTPFDFYPELNYSNPEYAFIGFKTIYIKRNVQFTLLADDFRAITKKEIEILDALIAKAQ
ncbi:MAG: hypothetical protein ACOVNY_07590 [Chitinophagaceae bacterium]